MGRMVVVQIIPDDRDVYKRYDLPAPVFGSAPTALLQGFAELGNEVEVHVVSCVRRDLPAPRQLAGNIYFHQLVVRRGAARTVYVEHITRVRRELRKIGPQIVHGQGTETYAGICAAWSGFTNCITIHGNMRQVARKLRFQPFPYMHIVAASEWMALQKTHSVFCNSRYTAECAKTLNHSCAYIKNAVRKEFFDLAQARTSGEVVLLCAGTVVSYKNQIALMEALDPIAGNMPLRLVFAGGLAVGEYGKRFTEMVAARKWCEHRGRVTSEELKELLASASALVHPTLEDSFGLVVAEAQALGVPVIASSIGGIPDLVEDQETGLLIDPNNAQDIQERIGDLSNAPLVRRITEQAHLFARKEYLPQIVASHHMECYRALLGRAISKPS
jgi:glycosyltransferase involved in cell wall biosynthesis